MRTFIFSLQAVFFGLKLAELVDWSWWIVLSPMITWLSLLFIFGFLWGVTKALGLGETEEEKKERVMKEFVNSAPNSPEREKALQDMLSLNKN